MSSTSRHSRLYDLIIGPDLDAHVQHIKHRLRQRGRRVVIINTENIPTRVSIEWAPKTNKGALITDREIVPFDKIKAVYWRQLTPFRRECRLRHQDAYALLKTFLLEPNLHWVNSAAAIESHQCKPRQLNRVSRLGVPIPESLITAYSESAHTFLKQHKSLIVKPIHGGTHSLKIDHVQTRPNQLSGVMGNMPFTLQQYISGTNIRTYVFGAQVFSIEIKTSATDYRDDNNAMAIATQTPTKISQMAIRVMKALGMQWTAIDWRRDKQGQYYFLEANPSPMFIDVERVTGLPLTRALVDLLLQNKTT